MPLDASLASIPGLAGFLAKKQMNEQGPMQDMQQATQALSLSSLLGQKKDEAQIKAVIESGAPPEKVVNALLAMGPKGAAAAHQYATAMKDMQAAKSSAALQNLTPEQLQDPVTLDRLGASGTPGTAHFTAAAERLRKKAEMEAALKTMRRTKGDDGTMTGGHFGTLMESDIPAIANQAKTAQSQLDVSGASVSPQHWIDMQKALAQQEGAIREKRKSQETPTVTDDTLAMDAWRYLTDGTLPPNMGRGAQGAAQATKIRNESSRLAKEMGMSPDEIRFAQLNSKTQVQAIGQLAKAKAQILQFEKTASMNADLALQASEKVDRTGTPILNKWIQAGRTAIAGDVEASKFHAATETFVSEYAKVMSGGYGAAATTEGAQQRAHTLLNTAHTKEQFRAVVGQLKAEMNNRVKALNDQMEEERGNLRKGIVRSPAAPAAAATPPPAAAPASSPAGSGPFQDPAKEQRYQEWKRANGR